MADIPEPIQQWLDLTNLLMAVAEAWAAGDPDQQSPDALANMTRITIRNTALASVLASARANRVLPPAPQPPSMSGVSGPSGAIGAQGTLRR